MRHLDLFSGIGGFALACKWVWGDEYENVGHSEVEEHACKVYHKHFPESKCLGDIKNIGEVGTVDLITGGFPCQPFSVAGKRRGKEDDRHLWPEMLRVISTLRPHWVLGENVAGIINLELDQVLSDLENQDYEVGVFVIPACGVDAPHRRDRVWIVAYSERLGWEKGAIKPTIQLQEQRPEGQKSEQPCEVVANTQRTKFAGNGAESARSQDRPSNRCWWSVEPNVGRVAHGVSSRVDRLKGLGNAIVPQVAEVILRAIKECA